MEKRKATLDSMKNRQCNVFVSHVHEDDSKLQGLKNLLNKHGCGVRDYSINSSKPNNASNEEYIWHRIIKPKIDLSGTVAVLMSPDMTDKQSEWVNKEIEYAHKCGKRIVGIWAHGERSQIPHELDELADSIVDWNGNRMKRAILDKENIFCGVEGTTLPPRNITRHGCSS